MTVISEAQKALAAPQDWSQITLEHDARMAMAEAAHVLRFGDAEGNTDTAIEPRQLLHVRRREDQGADLWTNFNVVQENCIRGGLTARRMRRADGTITRRTTTREVNGIDQDVKLNKALFVLGERMAALLKNAA